MQSTSSGIACGRVAPTPTRHSARSRGRGLRAIGPDREASSFLGRIDTPRASRRGSGDGTDAAERAEDSRIAPWQSPCRAGAIGGKEDNRSARPAIRDPKTKTEELEVASPPKVVELDPAPNVSEQVQEVKPKTKQEEIKTKARTENRDNSRDLFNDSTGEEVSTSESHPKNKKTRIVVVTPRLMNVRKKMKQ